ncbi:MAG: phenylacetate--CoA ligase family protein [Planctomycetes bacterium]|nr:phenylacetate--CoA ligase family protein [Planctomycetota bacterium]
MSMSITDNLHRYLTGKVVFPISNYLLNRKHITRNFQSSLASQWYSAELLRDIQLKKLKQTIHYAFTSTPYYKKKFTEIGLHPNDIRELEDIKHIPPLSRGELVEYYQQMVDYRLAPSISIAEKRAKKSTGKPLPFAPFRKHKLIKNTSSGSSGKPVIYYEDGSTSAVSWGFELLLKRWYDVQPGAKEVRIMRLPSDYMPNNTTARLRRLLWRQQALPGIGLSDTEYEMCLAAILEFKPAVLWGFASALIGLAEYIQDNKKLVGSYRPKLIIGWAEPVYKQQEQFLSEIFQCPVTNIYSTHEVGHIAAKCSHGSFHINQENLLVETQLAADNFQNLGLGEVLVTILYETPMPFIRYRVGDVGEVGGTECACGRNLQVLSKLAGRTTDIFTTKKGRMISPNFWFHLLRRDHLAGFIKQFQIVYRKDGGVRLNIIKKNDVSMATEPQLQRLIEESLGLESSVEFTYVTEIQRAQSGKFKLIMWED